MSNQWVEKWSEDIEQLKMELPQLHKKLFFYQNKRTFNKKIKELKDNIEGYDRYMIIASIAQIVASFRDAHTSLIIPASRFLPFEFYWFAEGIYIVDSSDKYREYIYSKITHIDGKPIDEVIRLLSGIISYENNWFLMSQLPRYLAACEILFGLEIINDLNKVELSVESLDKETRTFVIDSFQEDVHKCKIIKDNDSSKKHIPLYRKNCNCYFWSYFIKESNTLYFNYNYCKDMEEISVVSFCSELITFIYEKDVKKLVIDLRNNPGGNSTLLEPFIRELKKCKKLNKAGGIFVIIGRDTFSSALLNAYSLKNKLNAIFIGEATGGKPNCFGEVKYFDLINSGLKIRYSTEYFKIIKDNMQMSLFPDIPFEVSFKDYLENRDPCMVFVLNYENE